MSSGRRLGDRGRGPTAGTRTCPAFARSLRGCARLLLERHHDPSSTSRMPQLRPGGVEHRDGGHRRWRRLASASMSSRRSKSVRLSPLTARNISSAATKSRPATQGPRAAEQHGLVAEPHDRGPPPLRARCAAPARARWCRLTRTSSTPAFAEVVEPDVEQRPTPHLDQALGHVVGERAQPRPEPRRQQEGLHPSASRTTPRDRIVASASARTASSPGIPSSQSAYSATDSAGVRVGAHPSCSRAAMSETDVAGVAEPVLARDPARLVGPVVARGRSRRTRCVV